MTEEYKNHHYKDFLNSFAPLLIEGLYNVSEKDDLYEVVKNDKVGSVISQSLMLLTRMIQKCKDMNPFFTEHASRMFVCLGLNFMRTYESEQLESIDNPEEFVKLSLDVCDRQSYPVLKSQSAKLIESLCDKIDGHSIFVCKYLLSLLEYAGANEG